MSDVKTIRDFRLKWEGRQIKTLLDLWDAIADLSYVVQELESKK